MLLSRSLLSGVFLWAAVPALAHDAEMDETAFAHMIMDVNNCPAYRERPGAALSDPYFLEPSLTRVGCAIQSLEAGKNTQNTLLLQMAGDEFTAAVRQLQGQLNIYNADHNAHQPADRQRPDLALDGTLGAPTRDRLFSYVREHQAYILFFNLKAYDSFSDNTSSMFYLNRYLETADVTQYRTALKQAIEAQIREKPAFTLPRCTPATPCRDI